MRLFTWYGIEIEFKKNREKWPTWWNRVDVYSDEVVINVNPVENNKEQNEETLSKIFQKLYMDDKVMVEFGSQWLDIIYEEGDESDRVHPTPVPLFQDIFIKEDRAANKKELSGSPIIVFHSYKGGVGRTLSLISLIKEISEIYGNNKKALIVDADLEAPGLTWMLEQGKSNEKISYLDILELLHFNAVNDGFVKDVARLVETNVIKVETEKVEVEHYFLPVYREQTQVFHISSNPEKIIAVQKDKYIITEFLSRLGMTLGVDFVLVDLRAGITEYSAPFLFDARVNKFFISSTSMQSIMGTKLILEEIHRKVVDGHSNSNLLLTMIPGEMEENTVGRLEDELAESLEQDFDSESMNVLREDYLYRVPFDSTFVSLGNFQEICTLLKGKTLSDVMGRIAGNMLQKVSEEDGVEKDFPPAYKVKDTIERLHEIASKEISAEANSSSNMMATTSIREIVREFRDTVPQLVVLGAKGSGKTYIYKQLLSKITWENFAYSVDGIERKNMDETNILPLVSSISVSALQPMIQTCIQNCNKSSAEVRVNPNATNCTYNKLLAYTEKELSLTEWIEKWQSLMLDMLGGHYHDLPELDQHLEQAGKRIVFLVDGLEDLFMELLLKKPENCRLAIRALCQNVVNTLRNLQYGNIGIIIFARKDMAEEAISINFEQFQNQYCKYELKWTSTEALRLVLWISQQAEPDFGKNIDVLKASREALEKRLERLWGKKLGKIDSRQAYSAKWIIAALSDFTKQLQARDIVRFLQFSTSTFSEGNPPYDDRYIMPSQIRNAIPECSKEKYKEIREEMKASYSILKVFENMPEEEKELPLTLDKIGLTGEQIARLESQGYLIMSDKKYYFPEIIRFALGFQYTKRAKPKVLSLLAK